MVGTVNYGHLSKVTASMVKEHPGEMLNFSDHQIWSDDTLTRDKYMLHSKGYVGVILDQ